MKFCYRQIGKAVSVEIRGDDLGRIVVEPGNRRTGSLGEGAVSVARRTFTVLSPWLLTAMSAKPSPLKSATAR